MVDTRHQQSQQVKCCSLLVVQCCPWPESRCMIVSDLGGATPSSLSLRWHFSLCHGCCSSTVVRWGRWGRLNFEDVLGRGWGRVVSRLLGVLWKWAVGVDSKLYILPLNLILLLIHSPYIIRRAFYSRAEVKNSHRTINVFSHSERGIFKDSLWTRQKLDTFSNIKCSYNKSHKMYNTFRLRFPPCFRLEIV